MKHINSKHLYWDVFLHNINKPRNKVPLLQIFLQDTLQVASHGTFSFFFSASDTKTESLLQLFGHSCWGTTESATSRTFSTERPPPTSQTGCRVWTVSLNLVGGKHTHTDTGADQRGDIRARLSQSAAVNSRQRAAGWLTSPIVRWECLELEIVSINKSDGQITGCLTVNEKNFMKNVKTKCCRWR